MKLNETVKKYMLQGLDDMRQSIDSLDSSLFYLIVERVHLVVHMAASKIKKKIPLVRSPEREAELKHIIDEENRGGVVSQTFFYSFFEKLYRYSLTIMEYMDQDRQSVHSYLEHFSDLEIEDYRLLLNNLDRAICNILSYRFDVVYQVGVFKKQRNLPTMMKGRWQKIIADKRMLAEDNAIDPDFIEALFDVIHSESLRIEKL